MDREVIEILNQILHNQTTMSEDISSMKADISSMKADISALQKDVGSMKADISALQADVKTLKKDVNDMKGDISALQKDVGSMKSDISVLQKDSADLHSKIANNTIMLESTRKDIRILAEVQKSHYEQNQREHQEMLNSINNRADIIELAVKSISTSVREVKAENQSLDTILGRHDRAIETIKRNLAKTV